MVHAYPAGEDMSCGTFGSRIETYIDGNISNDVLRSRISTAMTMFSVLVKDQMGIIALRINEIELENDGSTSGIRGPEDDSTEKE